jgi:hypothetical protein
MINLIVDEAYAFDYLSILFIKKDINEKSYETWNECSLFLQKQLENNLWNQIISSQEYLDLIKINQAVFDAVEQARYGTISAKEVDDKNMQRYYQKMKLQNTFFINSKLKETKT